MYAMTPCGRYGKNHSEQFLRRRSNQEPMLTPRRYYYSDSKYNEGKDASTAAWDEWKVDHPGAKIQTPFFELADRELREINKLIQRSEGFQQGLARLAARVATSQQAEQKLANAKRARQASKDNMDFWAEQIRKGPPLLARLHKNLQIRKGPPLLARLHKNLQIDEKREDAKHVLDQLCDDEYSAGTMGPPSSRSKVSPQRTLPAPSRAVGLPTQLATFVPSAATKQATQFLHPSSAATARLRVPTAQASQRRSVAGNQQGEEFGLGHNPGEQRGRTVAPGNMYAPTKAASGIIVKDFAYPPGNPFH